MQLKVSFMEMWIKAYFYYADYIVSGSKDVV